MEQEKWFNRVFDFTTNQNILPSIIERLSGTPARLDEKLKIIPPQLLTRGINDKWTISENIGHLTDLESLWQGRLKDILHGETELRSTDLQNSATTLANHNASPIEVLLKSFRTVREHTVSMLTNLDDEQIGRYALHPRLKTPMRTIDLFVFVAEHDDHHLARITELQRLLA